MTTGEPVLRETSLPGAVLTRVAASHIRVGTFQYLRRARRRGRRCGCSPTTSSPGTTRTAAAAAQPYRALLEAVIARQAALVARWLLVGFIHGVMNTDNMSISGETIDYGPCAFMDAYDPAHGVQLDRPGGRYAYGNQPRIAQWNLARLAEMPAAAARRRRGAGGGPGAGGAGRLRAAFEAAYLAGLRRKLGLATAARGRRARWSQDLLERMAANQADFTLDLPPPGRRGGRDRRATPPSAALFADPAAFDDWAGRWRERLAARSRWRRPRARAAMRAVNPAFIPRNHRVEAAIAAAVERDDFAPFEALLPCWPLRSTNRPARRTTPRQPPPEQRGLPHLLRDLRPCGADVPAREGPFAVRR